MPKKDKNRKNYQDGGDVNPVFTVKGSDLPPWETLTDTEKRRTKVATSKYFNLVESNPGEYGFESFDAFKTSMADKYGGLGNVAEGVAKDLYGKAEFGVKGGDISDFTNITSVNIGGQNLTSYDDTGSVIGGTTKGSKGVTSADNTALRSAFSGAEFGGVSAEKKIVHYVMYNPEGTSTKYYRKEVYEGDPPPAGYVAGPFPDAASATAALNALVEQAKANEGSGGGGTGRNEGEEGGIEQRFSDVTQEVNYQAGLTGVDPTLKTGEQVVPTQMQALSGELENTTGTLLAGSQEAATTGITTEQMKKLEVSGYTDPASANTIANAEKAQTSVNALALSAAQTNALTGSAVGQTGTLSTQAIADIGPQTESIDVKKAEGTFEAPNMQGVTASSVPSANLVETDYNVAAAAAKRDIQTEELATAATLGQNVAQAQAAIQSDLNNQALTQAAQTTALENAGVNAEAVQQQMADVPLEATVQGQLTNLMAQFAGGQTPAFAAAAIRNAEAQMAARGLSASSMAGAAIMQAAMESSIPIAAQDAQIFREINLTNLNNKQQIALANQAAAQNINLANLNNRQQAALSNSTNAFKLQSDSLSNSQQVALANAQLKAAIQGQELTNAQQTALTNAARYAEVNGINLSNEQQTSLANTSANLQVAMANLSNRQQTALANAQIEAAIKGQELTNAQQAAVLNTQRLAEINNLKFTEEQTRNLNESQIMQNLTLANLDADMKMALQNAATYAGMDMANLNNRQQAQVLNAQSFLQLDLANLTNKQQGEVLKYQTKAQALFSDQAAENAKNQFNAQSENQSDQFFAQLGASVAQQNSDRVRGMLEFNVNEANAIEKFNTSVADTRDKFNATMQQQINQSNASWRRQINTVNTAAQNEANRLNALNTLQISQNRLNQLWQQYRDESTWLQQQQFNRDQYIHELAKINLTGDVNRALFNAETKAGAWQAVGDRLVDWIFDD